MSHLALLASAFGCESDDEADRGALDGAVLGSMDGGGAADGGSGPDGALAAADGSSATAQEALYLIGAAIDQGDTAQTYLHVTKAFDSTTAIDPRRGLEFQGWVYPALYGGSVYVGDANAPTVTRYDVSSTGALEKGPVLSFAGTGVSGGIGGYNLRFVSPQKAYLLDSTNLRAIVWNPSQMVLAQKEISLSMLARSGLKTDVHADPYQGAQRGEDLFLTVTWRDQNGQSKYSMGLVIIDTSRDEVRSAIEDERCGDSFGIVKGSSGELYVFPSAGSGLQFYVNATGTPKAACMLRVRAQEYGFDPSFVLDLSALAGGTAAQGAIPDGRGGFFFAALDRDRYANRTQNFTYWRLWHYNFETGTARAVQSDSPFWSGAMRYYELDGKVVAPRWDWTATIEGTTFWNAASGQDLPATLFTIPAAATTIGRIR